MQRHIVLVRSPPGNLGMNGYGEQCNQFLASLTTLMHKMHCSDVFVHLHPVATTQASLMRKLDMVKEMRLDCL